MARGTTLPSVGDDEEEDERSGAGTVPHNRPPSLLSRAATQLRKWLGLKEPKRKVAMRRKKRRRLSDVAVPVGEEAHGQETVDAGLEEAEPEGEHQALGEDKVNAKEKELDEEDDPVLYAAAVKCQSVVRRFLARFARHRQWKAAVKSAEYFELKNHEAKQARAAGSRQRRAMFDFFVKTYANDVLSTAKLFLVQSAVIVQIQALYRGYRTRKRYNLKRLLRRPKPRPTRITSEMARRVWARAEFEPKGGWPGMRTSVLEYDLFEHADRPPSGRDYGVKTYKVVASARNRREEQVLRADGGAWVGLPVHLEPHELYARRRREQKPATMLLHGTTPYLEHRIVKLQSPPRLQGLALLKSLGWRDDMVDRETPVAPPVQRTGYQMVNPLETHKSAQSVDSLSLPGALHKRINPRQSSPAAHGANASTASSHATVGGSGGSNLAPLGSLLQAPVSELMPPRVVEPGRNASPTRGVWTSQGINDNSVLLPDVLPGDGAAGVGAGGGGSAGGGSSSSSSRVGGGGLGQGGSVAAGGSTSSHSAAMSTTFLPAPAASAVTRLVTPLRGALKPVPSSHRAALAQHDLLPAQVNFAYKRARANGYEDERWRTSTWGSLKLKASEIAASAAADNEGRGDADDDDDNKTSASLDSGGSLSIHPSRSTALKPIKSDPNDPWTRQVYRPKIPVPCRIEAFPNRPKKHFKVRYSWLPQPLLGQAANQCYIDPRFQPLHTQRRAPASPSPSLEAGSSFLTAGGGLSESTATAPLDLDSQSGFVTHWSSLDPPSTRILGPEVSTLGPGKATGIVDHPYPFL